MKMIKSASISLINFEKSKKSSMKTMAQSSNIFHYGVENIDKITNLNR